MRRPYWIPHHAAPHDFPSPDKALLHPDGLLAVGGDLTPNRLMVAYRRGIFPWYSEDEPILWWAPSQRLVLFPKQLKVSRSLRKTIRQQKFTITLDQDFRNVISQCAGPRRGQPSTWLTTEMQEAYTLLHNHQLAHSVESWYEGQLVGGLYGVTLGKVFFGESMFSRMTDASKVAFAHLVWQLQRWGYELIDCQVHTQHLESLGAVSISRQDYNTLLNALCDLPGQPTPWQFDNEEVIL
jgi:leucyl/phenylalanyl-tRNA--protein transferase